MSRPQELSRAIKWMNDLGSWGVSFVGILIVGIFAFYIFFVPKMWMGDLFFGKIPILYNSEIAQFFYQQAIRFDSESNVSPPYAYHQLSRTYFIEGEFEPALFYANAELQSHPDHVRTNYIKGLTLGYMHREREAIDAFGVFIESNPNSWAARNDKAWLHFRIGDLAGGLETIAPAAELYPNNPWVMNTYGVLLMNMGQLKQAKEALLKAKAAAMVLSPDDWGRAYPGNSPQIYLEGLQAMRTSINENLKRIDGKMVSP